MSKIVSRGLVALVASLTLAACTSGSGSSTTPPIPTYTLVKGAVSGIQQRIYEFSSINPDCTSLGNPVARTITQPTHGTISVEVAEGYPNFTQDNVRFECNRKKAPVSYINYTSTPGYTGADTAKFQIVFPTGAIWIVDFKINVV